MVGSEKAYSFLVSNGFESEYAEKVKNVSELIDIEKIICLKV